MPKQETDISKLSPAQFARIISRGNWHPAPHLILLDNYLQKLIERQFRGLIVNMPPRHGKSELISLYFPAWHLVRFPDKRIILSTYSNQFASIWGRRVKEIIQTNSKMFELEINREAHSAMSFEISGKRGGMHSTGAGSSITGRGADLLIIDDPVKNNIEAKSPLHRNTLWDWFNSTALTRLEPMGVLVMLMTRWHPDDLCGRLLEKFRIITPENINLADNSNAWMHISLPAIAKENDPLGRNPGDALWPTRFDREELNNIKSQLPVHWFQAMYQQEPVHQEDSLFKSKDFRYFSEKDDFYILGGETNYEKTISQNDCLVQISVDLAVKIKESSDYTVAIVFAITPDSRILILDVFRDKIAGIDQIRALVSLYEKWNATTMGIESVQFQTAIIYQLQDMGYNIMELQPTKDKSVRAQGISIRLGNGRVYFKAKAKWLNEFEKELLQFPGGKHDDQVDAFAYIDKMIYTNRGILPAGKSHRKDITNGFI